MGVLRRLLEALAEITVRLDEEVEKGYDLSNWGDQMKFLHALQLQAQMAIDMVLRLSSLLGHPPSTPLDAARHLVRLGLMSEEEYRFFRGLVGFRNIVVHEYLSVDMRLVDEVLRERRYRRVLLLAEKLYNEATRRSLDP